MNGRGGHPAEIGIPFYPCRGLSDESNRGTVNQKKKQPQRQRELLSHMAEKHNQQIQTQTQVQFLQEISECAVISVTV